MKRLFVFILMLFIPFAINAEELKMDWQKSFGGSENDSFEEVLHTLDGGFIAVGSSGSIDIEDLSNKGGDDAIIVKYDKEGNVLWQKSWGGNDWDQFDGILNTSTGDFIVYGSSSSTNIEDLTPGEIIVKYDKDGNVLWQQSWGGDRSNQFNGILLTSDDGIIAFGNSDSTNIEGLSNKGSWDAIIVKYDKDGNLLWQKNWGGKNWDGFEGILQSLDGCFIAYGYSFSSDIEGLSNKGRTDAIIVKYDKNGNILWQKSWGGNDSDQFEGILNTSNGDFIVYGYSNSTDIEELSNKGGSDAIIVKYDKDGNVLWQKSWGGNNSDIFEGILQGIEEEIIVYGYSTSTDIEELPNNGYPDAIIIKYDKDGNMLWQKSWGGNEQDNFKEIFQTSDGDLIVSVYSKSSDIDELINKGLSDAIIVKYDKDGNMLWQKSWGGNNFDGFNKILQISDSEFILSGYSRSTDLDGLSNKGNDDAIVLKYFIEYDLQMLGVENGMSTIEQQLSKGVINPLPNDGYEVDEIIVKDKEGNVLDVEVTKLEDGTYSFDLYTDVSVEVLFKEKLVNPKTGVASYIGAVLSILFISIATFCVLVFNKKSYRL